MKKLIFSVFLVLLGAYTFSQSNVSQIVIPQRIYVGDTAELHYSFVSPVDLFPSSEDKNEIELALDLFPFKPDNDDFLIKKAVLQKNPQSYTIEIIFVAWNVGFLKIPEFDLASLILKNDIVPIKISPSAIEVYSVIQKEDMPLSPSCPPLLLPGTIYFVYISAIVLILIIILFVNIFIRRAKIYNAIKSRLELRKYAKNSRKAMRSLKILLKNGKSTSDADFAFGFEKIMREYLTVRFGKDFKVSISSKIFSLIDEASGGFLDDEKRDSANLLGSLFIRCDYIRFAHDSVDSMRLPKEKYAASFNENERSQMIEKTRSIIISFEKTVKSDRSKVDA